MRCALSSKYAQGQLILLGGGGSRMEELLKIGGEENSSSIDDTLAQVLSDNGWTKYGAKSLIVCEDGKVSDQSAAAKTEQSTSTVLQGDKFKVVTAGDLSVYDIVCHDHLFLTQKAVDYLERRYGAY
jgi:ribosomal protein L4